MRIGSSLRKLRKDRGMTQKEVAKLAGISPGYVCMIEQNVYINSRAIEEVAKALGFELSYLENIDSENEDKILNLVNLDFCNLPIDDLKYLIERHQHCIEGHKSRILEIQKFIQSQPS